MPSQPEAKTNKRATAMDKDMDVDYGYRSNVIHSSCGRNATDARIVGGRAVRRSSVGEFFCYSTVVYLRGYLRPTGRM